MKITKKKLSLAFVLALLVSLIVWYPSAQSRTKNYTSGEATYFNGALYLATVNTGALELFVLDHDQIVRTAMFKPKFVSLPKGAGVYHDLQFEEQNSKLYLHLTDGRYLYRFDVTNPYSPQLSDKLKDNAWDWFLGLDKTDQYFVTVGTKDIKYWNSDMQVVETHKVTFDKAENVSISQDGAYIFIIRDNVLEIYSAKDRKVTGSIWLKAREASIRGVEYDAAKKEIFVTDDEKLRVFDTLGNERRSFRHTGEIGYDTEASVLSDAVYFSDGIGIVKNRKSDLRAIDWAYTNTVTSGQSWAMDIDIVGTYDGEMVVVFNNSEISVLDSELELIDYFKAGEKDEAPIEALSLLLDQASAAPGAFVSVAGRGFEANEEISVSLAGETWTAMSDANGRFKRTIEVPESNPKLADIKATGLRSKLSYSISFHID